jgi:hypothetical protein
MREADVEDHGLQDTFRRLDEPPLTVVITDHAGLETWASYRLESASS